MSKKVLIDKQALIDKLMKIPGIGSNSDALKTIKRFPSYEPQKVKVPEEFDEWYQQIKQQRGFSEMIARHFALWKICQFGFGHDFEDVSHERTPLDLSVWVSDHKDEAVHAILNGYEVEEEPKYYVNIGYLYLKEPLGDTSDFTISMTWNREYAYSFDSWNMAREHASKLGGAVEQVEV